MLLAVHRWAPRLTQAQWPCLPFVVPGVAKDVAQNMAAFFQKVFVDQTTFDADPDQTWTAGGEGPSMSPVDLAGELVSDTGTCKELGYQAFDFFKVNPVCQKIWIFPPVGALAVRSAETTFRRTSRLCRLFRWDFLRFAVRRGRSGEKELKERRLFLRECPLGLSVAIYNFCIPADGPARLVGYPRGWRWYRRNRCSRRRVHGTARNYGIATVLRAAKIAARAQGGRHGAATSDLVSSRDRQRACLIGRACRVPRCGSMFVLCSCCRRLLLEIDGEVRS